MEQNTQLQKVFNFRDVGKTVNQFLGERTEILKQIKRRQLEAGQRTSEALQIQGLDYREIKINGKSFERHLLSLLSWWDFFKVVFFFILGYRIDALRVLSHQVMLPRGLVGLGLDTLDYCGSEICQALSLYTSPQSLPSIIHCTQGKDRLICALVLMILGIPRAAVEHDYFLTDAALMSSRPQMLVEIHEIGLTDDWAGTAEDMISSIEDHIKNKYGGLENYLDSIGFGRDQRVRIWETLLF
ncbi:hypothetical protein Trco_005485 [Trichoderma cornu-damae]|uniref:Tyrosine specific protein phosphatases domain-containing protein n=1 Tax=Trichoderma cornu-damae TaxID=654480 RepID=A0A9P8QPL9_9HYPO|nr:hypothetical protein Trco_005485 [Trichoderma cornu-damae]